MLSKQTLTASVEMAKVIGQNNKRLMIHGGSPIESMVGEFDLTVKSTSLESMVDEITPLTTDPLVSGVHSELVEESTDPVISQITQMVLRVCTTTVPLVQQLHDSINQAMCDQPMIDHPNTNVGLTMVRRERSLGIPHLVSELEKIKNHPKPPRKIFCPLMVAQLKEWGGNYPFLDLGVEWANNLISRDLGMYANNENLIEETLLKGNRDDFSPLEGTYISNPDYMSPALFEIINFFYWLYIRNTSQEPKVVETATVNVDYWLHLLKSKVEMYNYLEGQRNLFYLPLMPLEVNTRVQQSIDSGERLTLPVMYGVYEELDVLCEKFGRTSVVLGYLLSGGNANTCTIESVMAKASNYSSLTKSKREVKMNVMKKNHEFTSKQIIINKFREFIELNSAKFSEFGVNVNDSVFINDSGRKIMDYLRMFGGNRNAFIMNVANVLVSVIAMGDEGAFDFINRLIKNGDIHFNATTVQAAILGTVTDHYLVQTTLVDR